MSLDIRIGELRRQKGITVEELAERSGIPFNTVKKLSAGISKNPTLETMKALAAALDCTLDDFDDSVYPQTNTPLVDAKKAHLTQLYDGLNEDGQTLVVDYAELIASKPQYKVSSKSEEEDTVRVFMAAQSRERTPPGYVDMSKKDLEKIKNAPRSKNKL